MGQGHRKLIRGSGYIWANDPEAPPLWGRLLLYPIQFIVLCVLCAIILLYKLGWLEFLDIEDQ